MVQVTTLHHHLVQLREDQPRRLGNRGHLHIPVVNDRLIENHSRRAVRLDVCYGRIHGKSHDHASYNNEEVAISLERIIRCLSNLSEDFHNAFWNYIIMSTEAFVAYGEYAWCVVVGSLSLFLAGFGAVERALKKDGIKSKLFRTLHPYKITAYSIGKGVFSLLSLAVLWYFGREIYGINARDCCKYWTFTMIACELVYVLYSWKVTADAMEASHSAKVKRKSLGPKVYEWEGVLAIMCGYTFLVHPIVGINNYAMVFLSIAYLGPHILSITKGYNLYRRITYVTFTPITWFVVLFWCGWMEEFVIEMFEMQTSHIFYLCLVIIPLQNMARTVVESTIM